MKHNSSFLAVLLTQFRALDQTSLYAFITPSHLQNPHPSKTRQQFTLMHRPRTKKIFLLKPQGNSDSDTWLLRTVLGKDWISTREKTCIMTWGWGQGGTRPWGTGDRKEQSTSHRKTTLARGASCALTKWHTQTQKSKPFNTSIPSVWVKLFF